METQGRRKKEGGGGIEEMEEGLIGVGKKGGVRIMLEDLE